MLCKLCQNIQFKRYLDLAREEKLYLLSYCDEWQPDEPDGYSEDEALNSDLDLVGGPHVSFYFHYRELESLQTAADNGCSFCFQIFYGIFGITEVESIENSREWLYFILQTSGNPTPEWEHLNDGELDIRFGEESLGNMRLKDLYDFVKFAPRSQHIESNSSTGSFMNLDLAATWLYDCANYHEHCCGQSQRGSILPYRVLDLGGGENPQNIFLSVGEGRVGSYAALSYCWGKPGAQDCYITTQKNLKLRQEAVDISNFPKTFKDAIVVCRYLGIRYLWIDSLCIVQDGQDSKSDWQKQSERMGDIYSDAVLTISAAVGEDSHAGLFVDRDLRKTYPCTVNVQYPTKDRGIREGAFLMCRDWHEPEPAHIDTRGWIFQEKYLSTRTLGFSKTEMYWTCASRTASEGLPMGLIPLNNKSDFDRYIKVDANGNFSADVEMERRFHWWYKNMEIYSHRTFTHESDRLIALAGLASKFKTPGDEFLYGLWKSDLAHGLAWRLSALNEETATETSRTSPIPSWSWASCPGKFISYSDHKMRDGIDCNKPISLTSISFSGKGLPLTFFEVLSVESMPPTTNLAASSTRPSLTLRGLVLWIIPAKSCAAYGKKVFQAYNSLVRFQYDFSSANGKCKHFFTTPFLDQPVTKGDSLHCIPLTLLPLSRYEHTKTKDQVLYEGYSIEELASKQNSLLSIGEQALPGVTWCAGPISCRRMDKFDGFRCLLLKEVETGVKFRRVGYLELYSQGRLFDGVTPTILEII